MVNDRTILWRLDGVSLRGRPRPRLAGIDLTIAAGITAVAGPSGSGKSSLLAVLAGFVRPDGGQVEIRPDPAAASCYWVPAGLGLWPHLDVRRHLAAVTDDTERIAECLDWCRLDGLLRRRPATLSQGEATRLALARAFAARPNVLLLDEALVNLHRDLADHIWERLLAECRAEDRSLVFVTHQVERILADAERVCYLSDGRLLCARGTGAVYRDPPDEEVARFFGPCNWLDEAERDRWLGGAGSSCIRPEDLVLEPDPAGQALVEKSVEQGPCVRSRLREATGEGHIELVHRRGGGRLSFGSRVVPRLMALLLVACLVGCDGTGAVLSFTEVDTHVLSSSETMLPKPRALYASADRVYCLDTAGRVVIHDAEGRETAVWRMPEYEVGNPEGVLELSDGRVAVADTHYHRVVFFSPTGEVTGMFGRQGTGPGEFGYPVALAEDADDRLYVGEYGGNDRVQVFAADGTFLHAFGRQGIGPGCFQRPGGIAVLDEDVYVVDAFNNRIQRFSLDGEFEGVVAPEVSFNYPYDCCLDAAGTLWVVEYGAARITRLLPDGQVVGRYGSPGSQPDRFRTPWALTVLPSGAVWVADTGNARIVKLIP